MKKAEGQIMCYCAGITDQDITRYMQENPSADTAMIMGSLPWSAKPNCQENNPTGKCCKAEIRAYITSKRFEDMS